MQFRHPNRLVSTVADRNYRNSAREWAMARGWLAAEAQPAEVQQAEVQQG